MADRPAIEWDPLLSEIRDLLADLHHEIDNQGGLNGEMYRRAYEALLYLTMAYLRAPLDG